MPAPQRVVAKEEISFLSPSLLTEISRRMQNDTKQGPKALYDIFGGLVSLFGGDFYQLPHVEQSPLAVPLSEHDVPIIAGNNDADTRKQIEQQGRAQEEQRARRTLWMHTFQAHYRPPRRTTGRNAQGPCLIQRFACLTRSRP